MKNYLKKMFGGEAPLAFVPRFFGNVLYAAILGGIGLFILSSYQNKYASELTDFDPQSFLNAHFLQKPATVDPSGRPFWGRSGAPIQIIEFSDFECPFCKVAAVNLKPRLKERQNDVQLFFMNYPLDKQCNPAMQRGLHERACDAAKAALCADGQGKFWVYHDLLFENQSDLSREKFKALARKSGLNADKLLACLDLPETVSRLSQDIAAGQGAGIEGTPMVLVNGRPLKEWFNPVKLNLVLDEELRRAAKN